MTVRLKKAGLACYTYDSPDGEWEIQQWAWPPGNGPAWYRPGYCWHLWGPDNALRIKPEASCDTLTAARKWLAEKYETPGKREPSDG